MPPADPPEADEDSVEPPLDAGGPAPEDPIFIALGHRCSSAAVLDRGGFGAPSLPFDAIVCQLNVVRDCLEHGFGAFLNPDHYERVDTRTINVIDGVVVEHVPEQPPVNRYYENANRPVAGTDLTGTSTYHLQLATTHHDLAAASAAATYARRIDRLERILASRRRKIGVYIHPVMGPGDYERDKDLLLEEFTSFAAFLASRAPHTFVLFFVIVKMKDGAPLSPSRLELKNEHGAVHVIFANPGFSDVSAPFADDYEREVATMIEIICQQRSTTPPAPKYKIYFPLFDDVEATSNEMRLTLEGLRAHPRVALVDRPEIADYLVFCQNHLVNHNPLAARFRPIKDKYKEKTIFLDYDDNHTAIYDAGDFRWRLYFKRSCVDRTNGRAMDYGALPVIPTAYCVVDDMCQAPPGRDDGTNGKRSIDVACLFDDNIIDTPWFALARGRLLKFAKRLAGARPDLKMQIGTVSECGPVGRSRIDPAYKRCLFDSKIVLHANPDPWEGDARLWEALASGALVFVDRMYTPIQHPLVDGQHLVFYDLTEAGLALLENQILRYLRDDEAREKIGRQGREFVLQHHRSVNRTDEMLRALEAPPTTAPSREKPASKLDIVLGVAAGYESVDDYRQFVATLRRTGATCPFFLGIFDGPQYEPVKRFLLEHSVNYFFLPPIPQPGRICHGMRYEQYGLFLRDLDFRYALMIDFRDAYFQRDPFVDVERHMHDCDLYLMSEFIYLTVGNHHNGMNYGWVADAYGTEVADSIANEVILNSGATMGRKSAVMKLTSLIGGLTRQQNYEHNDQGTLNYLGHTGRLGGCGRVKTVRAGLSLVNNCGFSELDLLRERRPLTAEEERQIAFLPRTPEGRLQLYRDEQGWVLDDDGNVSYVVHQHDRFPEVDAFAWQLANGYKPLDRVFVNSGTRPYAAEKFTLSSRAGLKPDAVERLIAKIKSVSVDKKPLLVLDTHFRRGFAFAYGILNNELLFEPAWTRQTFFAPSHDSEKCDRFCEKWGYQPIFIDEAEIFETVVKTDPPRAPAASGIAVQDQDQLRAQIAGAFRSARTEAERWTPLEAAPSLSGAQP